MDNDKILNFIKKQKVAFICSVDEDGFYKREFWFYRLRQIGVCRGNDA